MFVWCECYLKAVVCFCKVVTSRFECGPTPGREDFLTVSDLLFSQSSLLGAASRLFACAARFCTMPASPSTVCCKTEHLLSQTDVGRTTAGSCSSRHKCARYWFEMEGTTSRPVGQLSSRSGVSMSCIGGCLLCCVGLLNLLGAAILARVVGRPRLAGGGFGMTAEADICCTAVGYIV